MAHRPPSLTAAVAATAATAAAAGIVVPALRALVERHGGGPVAGGLFIALHVLGGVTGAALMPLLVRRSGSRRLVPAALAISALASLGVLAAPGLGTVLLLRTLDGACHLLALSALLAGAGGAALGERETRNAWLGGAIVLGLAAGLGVGGAVAATSPAAALVGAAVLAAGAAVCARGAGTDGPRAPQAAAPSRGAAWLPALLGFCERGSFGVLAVVAAFALGPARTALVLGTFMTASVLVMPLARAGARRSSPIEMASLAGGLLVLVFALAAWPMVLARPWTAAAWALAGGAGAGTLYVAGLLLIARDPDPGRRARDAAAFHAAGSLGHATGALIGGLLVAHAPPALALAAPAGFYLAALALVSPFRGKPRSAVPHPRAGSSPWRRPTPTHPDRRRSRGRGSAS